MPQYLLKYDKGTAAGPFNIYLSGSDGLNLYSSGITRDELESGYIVTFDDGIPSSSVVIDNLAYACDTDKYLPFPTPTPSVTVSVSATPSVTPSISVTPSTTPSISVTPSVTPTVTPTATISVTPSVTSTPPVSFGTTPSTTPTPTVTRTPSVTPAVISYIFLGTGVTYVTSGEACNAAECAVSYYCNTMNPVVGTYVYTDNGLTTVFHGGNKWIAMNFECTLGFISYQIDPDGQIIDKVLCS